MDIYNNEFFVLKEVHQFIQIQVHKKGFPLSNFQNVIRDYPTLKITNDKAVYGALLLAKNVPIVIGERIPEISLSIAQDKMSATIRLACAEEDLLARKEYFVGEILKAIHQNKVTEGIFVDVLQESLVPQLDIIIAKGMEPVNGKDALIKYFSLSERKPTIRQDGKADYYDMNFIDEVKKGEWLGEKTPATKGIPGKTVTGEMVVPKKGRDIKLLYDRKTVEEVAEGDKIVLRALIDGVVTFTDGKIAVGDHLIIDGDVDVSTGNIDFDGSVTIKGIIQPGFLVKATKDISILGEMGLSMIEKVTSVNGDIFIKGGIFGRGKSMIKAGKNIFVKHANDSILEANEDIHIGYYSLGSYLKARNIIADERNGKIIGGKVEAKGKIVAAVIGNKMERKTVLYIEGFDRRTLSEQLEQKLMEYREQVHSYELLKRQLEAFENTLLSQAEKKEYIRLKAELDHKLATIMKLDEGCKYIECLLEVKGEGEFVVNKIAYPETFLQIKKVQKRLTSSVKGTIYINQNVLHFE